MTAEARPMRPEWKVLATNEGTLSSIRYVTDKFSLLVLSQPDEQWHWQLGTYAPQSAVRTGWAGSEVEAQLAAERALGELVSGALKELDAQS